MTLSRFSLLTMSVALLAGCTGTERVPTPPSPQAVLTQPPAAPALTPSPPAAATGPVLDGNGGCTGPVPGNAATIEPGIGECELVRLKGKPPTDVLVGEGRSGREVQVLYNEPGAKELYFFVNNKLDRIVKS